VILFGIPPRPVEIDVAENMIFKNLTVRALNGRRIFDTWYKTRWLLESGVVDLRPLITKTIRMEEINDAMSMLARGAHARPIRTSPARPCIGRRQLILPSVPG
jgi:threonine 3-dehydrogenase